MLGHTCPLGSKEMCKELYFLAYVNISKMIYQNKCNFHGNLFHPVPNHFLVFAYMYWFSTSFITAKWRHSKDAVCVEKITSFWSKRFTWHPNAKWNFQQMQNYIVYTFVLYWKHQSYKYAWKQRYSFLHTSRLLLFCL
jgi:hypothetical protein